MIKFENVEIKYGDFVAIQNLNLDIKEGEFFTFLGPSGCGKTTTLRSLVGFLTPSKGQIFIDETDVTNTPIEKREIGMVFQSYALFPTMSVYENIAFGLKIKKLPKNVVDQKVREIAEVIEISEAQLKKNVAELSGGQQQRVALARAIVLEPKILCLDEPLSNLDAKLRSGLRQELKRLQKSLGITTLYVTHDQEEALTLSDRIAVFNNGYIEQVGTPQEIYEHSKSEFVCDFVGDINKLDTEIISQINTQCSFNLDKEKTGFIRIEKIVNAFTEGFAKIDVTVKEVEYNGVITKYLISYNNSVLKFIELNSGNKKIKIGDSLSIYINPRDVMQY